MRKRPKVEVETYAGKVLRPEDLEDVPINTEDYGSILLEFDSGAHGCADGEPVCGRAQEPAVLRDRRQQVRDRRGTRSGRTSCGSAAATDRTRRS